MRTDPEPREQLTALAVDYLTARRGGPISPLRLNEFVNRHVHHPNREAQRRWRRLAREYVFKLHCDIADAAAKPDVDLDATIDFAIDSASVDLEAWHLLRDLDS